MARLAVASELSAVGHPSLSRVQLPMAKLASTAEQRFARQEVARLVV